MSGNNYNYSGYYGPGQPQNLSTTSTSNTGYQQYPTSNGYSSGGTGYFASGGAVADTSRRASTGEYATTSNTYNNRSNYDSSTVGSLAYNSSNPQSAQPTQPSRSYAPVASTYPQQYNAVRQQTPTYPAMEATHPSAYYAQTRPESSKSTTASTTHSVTSTARSTVGAATQPRPIQPPLTNIAHTPQYQSGQYYQQPSQTQQSSQSHTQPQTQTHAQPRYGELDNSIAAPARTNRPSMEPNHHSLTTPETVTATINPTQVYDPYHDWQRQAKRAEAEAKQRAEEREKEATIKAQQEQEKQRQANAQATPVTESESVTNATPIVANTTDAPAKKNKAPRKSDSTAPKRSYKKKKIDKDALRDKRDDSAQAAAMTLLQAANGDGTATATSTRPETELEKQMREMFKKMREFNSMNPDMLSRLWQEERDAHLAAEATPETNKVAEAGQPQEVPSSKPKSKSKKAADGTSSTKPPPPRKKKSAVQTADQVSTEVAQNMTQQQHHAPQPQAAMPQTQTPTQSTPRVVSATNGTIWPADKKASLAAAAADILTTSNPGKVVSSQEISTMLNQNPSYVELCEQLQGKGFVVDRSKFAKALLSAVPDINRPTPKQPANTTAGGSGQATAGRGAPIANMQATTATLVRNAEARLMDGESIVGTPEQKAPRKRKTATPTQAGPSVATPASALPPSAVGSSTAIYLEGLDAVRSFVESGPAGKESTSSKTGKAAKSSGKHRPSVQSAPLTKEGQARKRTFADLVDLTALSSEDEELASIQQPKRQEIDFEAPLPPIDDVDEPVQLPTPPNTVENVPAIPVVRGPRPPMLPVKAATVHVPTIAQNSTFPPTLKPALANPHPAAFKSLQVPHSVAPPSKVPRPVVPQSSLPHNHPAHSTRMAQPLDRYKAIRRSSYNPKTIARDVLLACGRHPDMRQLNAHLEILKTVFREIDNNADLGTFRWDIADPGGPAPGSGAEAPRAIDMYNDADDEDDSDDDSVVGGGQRVAVRQTIGADGTNHFEIIGQDSVRSTSAVAKSLSYGASVRRPVGGPRRSDGIRQTAGGTPNHATAAASSAGTPSGYSALRAQMGQQVDETGQPIKKRGRPVGWRKWMMKDTGNNNGGSPTSGPSGSHRKSTGKPTSPEPEYQVYRCEWKDCGAELHNLATLRKHLHKLHCKPHDGGLYNCFWAACSKVVRDAENGRTITRAAVSSFTSAEAWKQHVSKLHLEPIAWRLGDGPASGVSEPSEAELSEAYLSDAQGRRVTPRVVIPVQQASAPHPPRSSAHEKALEVERQAAKRKRDIGVGIDKGGARLATDKRRQGFIDDDDTAMVVDDDE